MELWRRKKIICLLNSNVERDKTESNLSKTTRFTAKMGECHFIFGCILDRPSACVQTAETAEQQKPEVMRTQLSLTNFKCGGKFHLIHPAGPLAGHVGRQRDGAGDTRSGAARWSLGWGRRQDGHAALLPSRQPALVSAGIIFILGRPVHKSSSCI